MMAGNRSRDTGPERKLRSAVHRMGLRFRVNQLILVSDHRVRPDLVFGPSRVAVFVDGCFWHRCPQHGNSPVKNVDYWEPKLDKNVKRDEANRDALEADGWVVMRFWEHEDPERSAQMIKDTVKAR